MTLLWREICHLHNSKPTREITFFSYRRRACLCNLKIAHFMHLLSRYSQSKYYNAIKDSLNHPMVKTFNWESYFKEQPSADSHSAPDNSLQNPPSNDLQSLLGNNLNNLNEISQIMPSNNPQKQDGSYIEVPSVSQIPSHPKDKQITPYDYFILLPALITALTPLISALPPLIISLKTNSSDKEKK